jgi:hypothetical protein
MVEKKGFVLFFDSNYLPYGLNLIDTLLHFSKYDIEVNCINFNYDFNNSRIKSKTIHSNDTSFFAITKCKIISTLNTDFDIGVLLDADIIATNDCDLIFSDNEEKIQESKFPLFGRHPHNPFNRWSHIISRLTDKQPKMGWVYSNYIFSKNHKWFFQEILDIMDHIITTNTIEHYYPVPEEAIINALLSKYECDYDVGYNYFPNCFPDTVEYYFNKNHIQGEKELYDCYGVNNCPVKLYFFHGHKTKDLDYISQLIPRLKNQLQN